MKDNISILVDMENSEWTAKWTMDRNGLRYGNAIILDNSITKESDDFDLMIQLIIENFEESFNLIVDRPVFRSINDVIQKVAGMVESK